MNGDASEVYALADDFHAAALQVATRVTAGMKDAGKAVETEWRNRAAARYGSGHAMHYPDSITSEVVPDARGAAVDIGPTATAADQGFLGPILEFGGRRSPAHWDGLTSLDVTQGRVERAIDSAMGHLFG